MWPDRVSIPGPLTYESGALPTALCGPARMYRSAFALPLALAMAVAVGSVGVSKLQASYPVWGQVL